MISGKSENLDVIGCECSVPDSHWKKGENKVELVRLSQVSSRNWAFPGC